jgi:hypothetical protein
LQEVVNSTLMTAVSGTRAERSGKLPLRVAVVISKADLACVKGQIGDVEQGEVAGATCREAIVSWGGENVLRALEHRVAGVEYFACSALGRAVEPHNRPPFRGSGVLEPLGWVLMGARD